MENNYVLSCSDYISLGTKILSREDVPAEHAKLAMVNLLDSDEKGIHTHGLYRIRVYVDQLRTGVFNAKPNIKIIQQSSNVLVLDGDNALGAVVSYSAMKEAISMAAEQGVGIAAVRNGSHFGTAAYWSEMAAAENQIGLACTNGAPAIAPTGSMKAVFGNNPWSISVPTNKLHPLTLDISNSVVARGKIRVKASRGEEIPLGWALNKKGEPTTDPREALDSSIILPIGDYKGYGITVMIDILAGVLTGANFADKVGAIDGAKPRNSGHFFMAIDIKSFMEPAEFKQRMDYLWDTVKNAPKIREDDDIYLPGEKEWVSKLNQAAGTVKIPEVSFKILEDLCKENGLSIPEYQILNGN